MTPPNSPSPITMKYALQLLKLTEPFSPEVLRQRYEEARRLWHPARYAGLTNNPTKYMEMYKKGESKTKDVEAAYHLLLNYLYTQKKPSTSSNTHEQTPESLS